MKLPFIVLIVAMLFLAGCGSQYIYMCKDGTPGGNQQIEKNKVIYVCPDGTETINLGRCSFIEQSEITQKAAEEKATDFVRGYVSSNGWQVTLVNVNQQEGDWLAQLVIQKREETSYETTVLVDGESGFVTCEKSCEYIS